MGSYSEYLDLISDSCIDVYKDNVAGNFVNDLPTPQSLPDNSYVALQVKLSKEEYREKNEFQLI